MVVLDELRSARQEGYDVVQDTRAWLDTDEYNNDGGAILLSDICHDYDTTEWDIDIARLLLSRGVDANYCEGDNGWTLLHDAVSFARNEHTRKLYEALIGAGADVNARAHIDNTYITPLGALLEDPGRHRVWVPHGQSDIWVPGPDILHHYVETATMLLRAGASLDACCDDESAEEMLEAEEWNDLAEVHEPNYVALKTLFAGVRRAGSWKLWTLEDVKALLRLRSLVARGRARERKVRTRRRTPREIALLFAPAFPNELFLKVMTYWNPRV